MAAARGRRRPARALGPRRGPCRTARARRLGRSRGGMHQGHKGICRQGAAGGPGCGRGGWRRRGPPSLPSAAPFPRPSCLAPRSMQPYRRGHSSAGAAQPPPALARNEQGHIHTCTCTHTHGVRGVLDDASTAFGMHPRTTPAPPPGATPRSIACLARGTRLGVTPAMLRATPSRGAPSTGPIGDAPANASAPAAACPATDRAPCSLCPPHFIQPTPEIPSRWGVSLLHTSGNCSTAKQVYCQCGSMVLNRAARDDPKRRHPQVSMRSPCRPHPPPLPTKRGSNPVRPSDCRRDHASRTNENTPRETTEQRMRCRPGPLYGETGPMRGPPLRPHQAPAWARAATRPPLQPRARARGGQAYRARGEGLCRLGGMLTRHDRSPDLQVG
jgi:hypothetical protein